VPASRLSFWWILRRKYRSGCSYAAAARGTAGRGALALSAAAKAVACAGGVVAGAWSEDRRNVWLLRGALHVGVVAGCLALRQPQIYG